MPRALDDLLRQTTLITLAAAIAIGWSAVELAQAISSTVVAFLHEKPDEYPLEGLDLFATSLSVEIGEHVLVLGPFLDRLLAFVLVVGAVRFVVRRRRAA
jgi:large-conductance mechanosensitive channel